MGAFQAGFQMGQSAYQQAQDNKQRELENERRRTLDERATTEFDNRQTDRATELDKQAKINALGLQLTRPNAGNYTMGAAPQGPGLRMGAAPQHQLVDPSEAVVPDAASAPISLTPQQTPAPAGPGMRMQGQSDPGVKAPQLVTPMGGYTANPVPTRGAAEDIMAQRALLRGDDSGYRAAQSNKRAFEFEDQHASHIKDYTGSAEQMEATMLYLNRTSKAVTMGAPDKNGLVRISVVKPDGTAEFMKLSKQDQARLYAGGKMMPVDPVKAIELMASVNKELAAAVAAENGLVGTVTSNNNDVASKSATITHGQQAIALQGASTSASVEHSKAQTSLIKQTVSEKKELDDIRSTLNTAIETGDEAAIKTGKSKLMNYMQSGKSGMQNLSPQERAANFYLASGAAKTLADAARMSHEKVQASPGDDYMKLMAPNSMGMSMKPAEANAIMTVRHGSNWKESIGGPKPSVSGAFATDADAAAAVKAGKIKPGDRVTINGVSGTWR